jgi:predicted nucleic acid-binding protein
MVVSDTNILGSFAAADALPSLFAVLVTDVITIPPAVEAEIQAGVVRGAAHLRQLLDMVADGRLVVVTLDELALALAATLPRKLNAGEREAIGLAAQQQAVLLTNDRRALNYCTTTQIATLDLKQLLRGLWVRKVVTRADVQTMIARMERVDRSVFLERDLQQIFAPRRRRR